MQCFAADATVDLMSGESRITLANGDIRETVGKLLAAFDHIKLTPTTRQVSASRVVEESVISGDHTGSFAGAQPTSSRVWVNVKLSATAAAESQLQSLLVEADTRALFAQIAGTEDVIGVTGGLIAAVRERHDGAVRVTRAETPPAVVGAWLPTSRSRGMWAALVAAMLLLAVFLVWKPGSPGPVVKDVSANHPVALHRSTSRAPSAALSRPAPRPSPRTHSALPAIKMAAPTSVPHVQPGRQVVLNSDVLFGFDSAVLTSASRSGLVRVASQVRRAGLKGTIQVNGYTDNRGSAAYDVALSRARALAVAGILQKGLAGLPITLAPQGFGPANPVGPNNDDRGRARNRRVTIVLPPPVKR